MSDDPIAQAPDTENPEPIKSQDPQATTEPDAKPADSSDPAPDTKAEPAGDPTPEPVKGDWPENWRDLMAKGDAKLRKRLDRFKSPNDITTSFIEAEKRISSGDLKEKLPDDATEEQIAAYRKENGIPEKSEGYLENLPDGLVVGDEDKEIVGSFLERAHAKNADPAVVSDMIGWYYDQQEEAIAMQTEADKAAKQVAEDELRGEWGGEYRANINSMASFLDAAGADANGVPLKQLLLGARLTDGTKLGDNPAAIKWLTKMADEANPAGFVSPSSGLSQIDSVESEIAEIEKMMRTDRTAYNKDQKMQDRYLLLLEAKEKLNK